MSNTALPPLTTLDYKQLMVESFYHIFRRALTYLGEYGASEQHFIRLSFITNDPRVKMPDFLRQQYPEEMTIILQHRFRHLLADEAGFSVELQFIGRWQLLYVPWDQVSGFFDEPAEFAIAVPRLTEWPSGKPKHTKPNLTKAKTTSPAPTNAATAPHQATQSFVTNIPSEEGKILKPTKGKPSQKAKPHPNNESKGGKIVSLDQFRRKE